MFAQVVDFLKAGLRGGAGVMTLTSDVFNAALVLACVWATEKLWTLSKSYFVNAGVTDPREFGCSLANHAACVDYLKALAPGAHLRLYWLALAWICVVFACGAAIVTVGGLRWAWWRAHDILATWGR